MTKLTTAQTKLLKRAAKDGLVRPYGPEWLTIYRLAAMKLMVKDTLTTYAVTDLGRSEAARTP